MVILTQWMPVKTFPEKYSLQVGMTVKTDSHEVKNLTFLKIGPSPQADQRRDYRLISLVAPCLD
jgi:hypothetical protein